MTDWTRVKDKSTGHEFSWPTESVNPDAHEVLDKPAVDRFGVALPAKPNRPLTSLAGSGGTAVAEMTVPQLHDYAEQHKIDLGEASRKDDILAAIAAATERADDTSPAV